MEIKNDFEKNFSHYKKDRLSFYNIIRSFRHAFRGSKLLFQNEYNLYIQSIIAVFVLGLAFFLKISNTEWIFLLLVIFLVLFSELINSTVERIMDFLHPMRHDAVRDIKDLSAAIVLFSSFFAFVVGALIFLPKLLLLF